MAPEEIAADLMRRKCHLHHAINLPDFRAYARWGALLSRSQLDLAGGIGTPFASDVSDARRGLMDRCFGNLSDFGQSFWRFENAAPNPYGPITLVFKPDAFKLCVDLAVTKKNAGNASYDLATDRITDSRAWKALFRDDESARLSTGSFFLEVSSSTNTIPLTLLEKVVVEPITLGGNSLLQAVRDLGVEAEVRAPTELAKQRVLDLLVALCAHRGGTPPQDDNLSPAPEEAQKWWSSAPPVARRATFRWFEYLVSTLRELSPDSVRDPAAVNVGVAPSSGQYECDCCGSPTDVICPGCNRPLCREEYSGTSPDQQHDSDSQGRCWECAFDPT